MKAVPASRKRLHRIAFKVLCVGGRASFRKGGVTGLKSRRTSVRDAQPHIALSNSYSCCWMQNPWYINLSSEDMAPQHMDQQQQRPQLLTALRYMAHGQQQTHLLKPPQYTAQPQQRLQLMKARRYMPPKQQRPQQLKTTKHMPQKQQLAQLLKAPHHKAQLQQLQRLLLRSHSNSSCRPSS